MTNSKFSMQSLWPSWLYIGQNYIENKFTSCPLFLFSNLVYWQICLILVCWYTYPYEDQQEKYSKYDNCNVFALYRCLKRYQSLLWLMTLTLVINISAFNINWRYMNEYIFKSRSTLYIELHGVNRNKIDILKNKDVFFYKHLILHFFRVTGDSDLEQFSSLSNHS